MLTLLCLGTPCLTALAKSPSVTCLPGLQILTPLRSISNRYHGEDSRILHSACYRNEFTHQAVVVLPRTVLVHRAQSLLDISVDQNWPQPISAPTTSGWDSPPRSRKHFTSHFSGCPGRLKGSSGWKCTWFHNQGETGPGRHTVTGPVYVAEHDTAASYFVDPSQSNSIRRI